MNQTLPFVVVGLGNPGDEYALSRHNMGRVLLEHLAERDGIALREKGKHKAHIGEGALAGVAYVIVFPDTYMNKSGSSVKTFIASVADAARLIVVYDDLDLPWGEIRIAYARGSGGHNGVESIIKSVKTKDFIRVRIGVAPVTTEGELAKPRGEDAVLNYIMGNFGKREKEALPALTLRLKDALTLIMKEGRHAAMNKVNTVGK